MGARYALAPPTGQEQMRALVQRRLETPQRGWRLTGWAVTATARHSAFAAGRDPRRLRRPERADDQDFLAVSTIETTRSAKIDEAVASIAVPQHPKALNAVNAIGVEAAQIRR